MSKRPNFLFLITDQHRADWLGCYGHPIVKTPNIDAIAATGTRFDNFHVASPVCMPNRASLITGRYPTVHGLRTNGCLLPLRANTFVDVLAASGYHTAAIGKSHLQPFTDLAPLHPSKMKPARSKKPGRRTISSGIIVRNNRGTIWQMDATRSKRPIMAISMWTWSPNMAINAAGIIDNGFVTKRRTGAH